MTILKLIRLFDMKKEEGCISTLETTYSIEFDEAMDISDLISQLSSLKSDHEDWFEEISFENWRIENEIKEDPVYQPPPPPRNSNQNSENEEVQKFQDVVQDEFASLKSSSSFDRSLLEDILNQLNSSQPTIIETIYPHHQTSEDPSDSSEVWW